MKRYRREYQEPIRLKVINFLKRWIEGYFDEDFASDSDLLSSLQSFIEHIVKTNKRFGQLPLKSLQRKLSTQQLNKELNRQFETSVQDDFDNLKIVFKSTYSSSSSSSSSRSSSLSEESSDTRSPVSIEENCLNLEMFPPFEIHLENQFPYDILTIHPLEFARQVTLMEMEIFKEIKVKLILYLLFF